MLDLTRIGGAHEILEVALPAGTIPTESGLAYIRTADGVTGEEVATLSANGASEVFIGVAYLDKHAAAQAVRIYLPVLVPSGSPYTVVLPDATISNCKIFANAGTVTTPVPGSPLTGGGADYTLTNSTVVFAAAQSGKTVLVSYNYTLTNMQLQQLGVSPIPSAAANIGKIALLQGFCKVYVTNFNTSSAWVVNAAVTTGANGIFEVGGTSPAIGKCFHAPTAADPYLGLEYNTVN
jgi:hypothetical protein